LENGDVVWIVKPEYRAPLGEFIIVKAHPNPRFELIRKTDMSPHTKLAEEKYLRRDPIAVSS
jgi:hypothetical protein